MFSCPLCSEIKYDWNDKDTVQVKEATIKLIQDHIKEKHPKHPETSDATRIA